MYQCYDVARQYYLSQDLDTDPTRFMQFYMHFSLIRYNLKKRNPIKIKKGTIQIQIKLEKVSK
jgi:hypothetical protein